MDSLLAHVPAVLKSSVTVLVFGVGLQSTRGDLVYLWRRPRLLLRAALAMYVFVPLVALAMARLLPLSVGIKAAVLVVAISAGAPLVPRKLMPLRNDAYVFSLIATTSLLAVATVPAWLAALGAAFDVELSVGSGDVARLLGASFGLPIALGMGVRASLPRFAERASDLLMAAGGAALLVSGLVLLAVSLPLLAEAGWLGLFVLAALTGAALSIGHLMGGPNEENRTALAIACATRHVGIAVLVAAAVPGVRTAVLVMAYVVASTVASIPYIRWRKRYHVAARERAAPGASV
jgi:BASS family bile acid:Na+ symporter